MFVLGLLKEVCWNSVCIWPFFYLVRMEWCRQVHFKICKYQKLKRVCRSEGYLPNWMYMKHFMNKVFLNVAAAHGLKAASVLQWKEYSRGCCLREKGKSINTACLAEPGLSWPALQKWSGLSDLTAMFCFSMLIFLVYCVLLQQHQPSSLSFWAHLTWVNAEIKTVKFNIHGDLKQYYLDLRASMQV